MENYTAPKKVDHTEPKVVGLATDMGSMNELYRSHSVLAVCNSCNKAVPTMVSTKCSFLSYLCYCCYLEYWCIYQMYKRKDMNCCDATHHCSSCKQPLGNYQAC